mgnify:CR=1 FL=1
MNMITGSIPAIVTPMHEDGSLDFDSFRKLIEHHAKEGTDALVVVGTTGESPTVDVDEHSELIRFAVEVSAGRLPIIAGTGANSTAEAIELTRYAAQVGASTTSYPAGFTSETKAVGSLYTAPTAPEKAVNLSGAVVSFSGGQLASSFNNVVSVNAGSQVVNLSPNALSFNITTSLGTFSGTVQNPVSGITHNFGGVILQKQNAGYGATTGANASSRVVLAAP